MLPKTQRLTRKQFNVVLKQGGSHHSQLFLIRGLQSKENTKIAVVVSQKVAKTAVLRNKIRRKVYIIVEKFYDRLPKGVNVILFAKNSVLEASDAMIENDISQNFVKIGYLK